MKEVKFKVGDKVVAVVNDADMLTIDKIYEIVGVNDRFVFVINDLNNKDYFYPNKFVLAEDLKEVTQGVKYDSDKLEYSLLPKGVLTPILKVLSFGKKKYAADNWMKVDNPKERYYNALQRHITQWWEGEKYDSETGENHLAHAACCLMFLLWFENKEDGNLKGKDN